MSSTASGRRLHWVLRNTAFGALVGFVLAFCFAAAIDTDVRHEAKEFYSFIVTAVLSMAAAALTLAGVFATIDHQLAAERRARSKRLEAARAFLPEALSRMCEICQTAMQYSFEFEQFEEQRGEAGFRSTSISELTLTDEIISVFRDIIELSDDDAVSRRLAGLLREHQILLARWRSIFAPDRVIMVRSPADIRQRTVAWAYLGAIASSMFEYARGESHTIETNVGFREISSALNTSGLVNLHTEDHSAEIGLYERTFSRRFSET